VQDALEFSHRELQELSSALLSIREEERKRIARELHDDLGQLLAALRMDLAQLKGRLAADQPELSTMADRMDRWCVHREERVVRALPPTCPPLDDIGLYPALQSLTGDSRILGIA
jgi:glucose-6-phosphate-specific signal transduction histidine kinase